MNKALLIPTIAVLVTAACSGDDSSSPTTAAPTSAAPTTTVRPAPSTTASLAPGLPNDVELTAGDQFRLPRIAIGRGLLYTVPADGITGWAGRGGFTLNDADGNPLVAFVDLERAKVFTDPFADLDPMIDEGTVADAIAEGPADALAAFTQLPGIEVGETAPGELFGFQGTATPFSVTAVDQGTPCLGVPDKNCLLAFWMAAQNPVVLRAGDSGTVYSLDVEGRPMIAIVTDHAGAQESLDSLVLGV